MTEFPAPSPVSASVARVDLERAIATLADGYREVLILHDIFGYTHEEVGVMLQIEAGTSKSQLSRARTVLRRWLEEKGTQRYERRSD